jgi:hypothetical protein
MISINEIKDLASKELVAALPAKEEGVIFEVVSGESLIGEPTEDEPFASIEYDILFEFGNCKKKHAMVIGWNEDDGVGLEFGEDGDVLPITRASVMTSIYYDLALEGLDDKYLQ